ncbi:hypothetical protein K3495_g13829 [Podosphaera aphanis]|nr:hypothetical protein K3495_g13829 [Podosphaera aphanis]
MVSQNPIQSSGKRLILRNTNHQRDFLGDDDQAVFDQFERPNEIWKSLKDKYSEASAASASHYMKKIQKFPEEYDIEAKGITNAWQTLKGYAVKLGNADESFRNSYSEKFLFLILIKMLSDKYTSLLDGFRLRPDLTAQEKVTILEDKERDLKSTEQAYAVFDKQRRRREHRSSDVSMPDLPQEILCYKCDGDDHLAKACPFSNEIKAYGIALRKKFEKRNLKSRKIKSPKTSSARKAEKRTRSNCPSKSRKSHSYTACEDSSSNSDSSTDEDFAELSESDSDRPPAQKVMLSKALISNVKENSVRYIMGY